MRSNVLLLNTIVWAVLAVPGYGQQRDVADLLAQLRDPSTSAKAYDSIRHDKKMSADDRQEVGDAVSDIIRRGGDRQVWINAVRLAGELKLAAAAALAEQLRTPSSKLDDGFTSLSREMNLVTDPAGKSLAQIGDPAVVYVSEELNSGNRDERFRCVYILTLIGSPLAVETLKEHLPSESDPALKHLIQTVLGKLARNGGD